MRWMNKLTPKIIPKKSEMGSYKRRKWLQHFPPLIIIPDSSYQMLFSCLLKLIANCPIDSICWMEVDQEADRHRWWVVLAPLIIIFEQLLHLLLLMPNQMSYRTPHDMWCNQNLKKLNIYIDLLNLLVINLDYFLWSFLNNRRKN